MAGLPFSFIPTKFRSAESRMDLYVSQQLEHPAA